MGFNIYYIRPLSLATSFITNFMTCSRSFSDSLE